MMESALSGGDMGEIIFRIKCFDRESSPEYAGSFSKLISAILQKGPHFSVFMTLDLFVF